MRHALLLPASLTALAIAAAGCRSPGPAAPIEGRSGSTSPPGPVPTLTWNPSNYSFDAQHVPAVSGDGARVLVGIADPDGGRGNPNYRFELRDRKNGKVGERILLTTEEAEKMITEDGQSELLQERVRTANLWLAEQHAALKLSPLPRLEVQRAEEAMSDFRATGDGVVVEWKPSQLTIAKDGKPLAQLATPNDWLAKDRPMDGIEGGCHNPAFLGGVAISIVHSLALVTVQYGGTDTCWEPNPVHNVVQW